MCIFSINFQPFCGKKNFAVWLFALRRQLWYVAWSVPSTLQMRCTHTYKHTCAHVQVWMFTFCVHLFDKCKNNTVAVALNSVAWTQLSCCYFVWRWHLPFIARIMMTALLYYVHTPTYRCACTYGVYFTRCSCSRVMSSLHRCAFRVSDSRALILNKRLTP